MEFNPNLSSSHKLSQIPPKEEKGDVLLGNLKEAVENCVKLPTFGPILKLNKLLKDNEATSRIIPYYRAYSK